MAGLTNAEKSPDSVITSSLRLRGARGIDYKVISQLYKEAEFALDVKHLERLFVVEDEIGIIAVGSFVRLLEAAFIVNDKRSRRTRVLALTALVDQAEKECRTIGFDNYHVFATNEVIIKILKNKFGFIKTNAKQVLLKWFRKE